MDIELEVNNPRKPIAGHPAAVYLVFSMIEILIDNDVNSR